MSAGVVMNGQAAVDEVLEAFGRVLPFRLRVPPRMVASFWGALAGAGVRVVADPGIKQGQAVWMEPFSLPCRTLIALGHNEGEVVAWAGARGLQVGALGGGADVFGVWDHAAFSHLSSVTGEGLGLVVLPGWAEVAAGYTGQWAGFDQQLRHKVDVVLPADWVPKSERAQREESARLMREQIDANAKWRQLVSDLDRCPHWRHEGDVCAGWKGPGPFDGGCQGGISLGNPLLRDCPVLGMTVHGQVIAHPVPADKHDPGKWLVPSRPGEELHHHVGEHRCPHYVWPHGTL